MAVAAAAPTNRWLYGPLPDLLLGCGLWYIIAFEIFAVYGREIRLSGGLIWAPILMLLLGVPHHGATLIRVYERRKDRRAYTFFAVYASALVWLLFVAGVHNTFIGSCVLTVYLTWSPWHYTGQNYGIGVMFLRRGKAPLPPATKRWLYATFILSYLLTVLVMHHGDDGRSYSPAFYDTTGYVFLSLRIPYAKQLFLGVGAAYLVALCMTGVLLLRRSTLREIAPTACVIASQALWFSIPVAVRAWKVPIGLEVLNNHPAYYFLWIGVAHAVQYLWITSYYAKASPNWPGQKRYLGKALLAGAAIWTVPSLVFAPGVLGRVPFDAGLAELIAASVNLHHFILDGAIWKLRSGRVARVLIRSQRDSEEEKPAVRRFGARRLVWAAGALGVAIMTLDLWEKYYGLRTALPRGDLERVERALDRLSWVGRDSARLRVAVGDGWRRRGDSERAHAEFERALLLDPENEEARRRLEPQAGPGKAEVAADPEEGTGNQHLE